MDDSDAMEPAGEVWDHWIVWNVPTDVEIHEGWDPTYDRATEGTTDFGETGYSGPADREHTYRIRLYALDTTIDLPSLAEKDGLEDAIKGHVLDESSLKGKYAP